jgi:pimeloyl-[acyl-carrier protein] methyl ester esterase
VKLVLLHPLPLDATIWSDHVTGLAEECISPNLYVLGDDIRGWARAVLDLAGDGPMTLVGNSVGGSCAIEMALLAPDKVSALVLSGAKAGHDPDPALRDEALQLLDDEGVEAAWQRYWRPLFGPGTGDAIVGFAHGVAVAQGSAALANGVRAFHGRPDRDAFLDSWQGPVWVISGEHDLRPDRARSSADRLYHGHFREVPGVGHYVPIEAPQAFARIVAEAIQLSQSTQDSEREREREQEQEPMTRDPGHGTTG